MFDLFIFLSTEITALRAKIVEMRESLMNQVRKKFLTRKVNIISLIRIFSYILGKGTPRANQERLCISSSGTIFQLLFDEKQFRGIQVR